MRVAPLPVQRASSLQGTRDSRMSMLAKLLGGLLQSIDQDPEGMNWSEQDYKIQGPDVRLLGFCCQSRTG